MWFLFKILHVKVFSWKVLILSLKYLNNIHDFYNTKTENMSNFYLKEFVSEES